MIANPRAYEMFKTYLKARIESEFDRQYRPHLLSEIRAAGVEALGAVVFTGSQAGEYLRSADELARFAARKAMGLEVEQPRLSPVPAPTMLAAMQTFAERIAQLFIERESSLAHSAPAGGVDVRTLVKQEVASFHKTMHRGVWREGESYERGQMVTRGGSTWSCQQDDAQGKPGESADWLLVVKAGRDGRRG